MWAPLGATSSHRVFQSRRGYHHLRCPKMPEFDANEPKHSYAWGLKLENGCLNGEDAFYFKLSYTCAWVRSWPQLSNPHTSKVNGRSQRLNSHTFPFVFRADRQSWRENSLTLSSTGTITVSFCLSSGKGILETDSPFSAANIKGLFWVSKAAISCFCKFFWQEKTCFHLLSAVPANIGMFLILKSTKRQAK